MKVLIDILNFGEIEVELYEDVAPITVANFVKLVKEDFYTNSKFHRIIKGFMIQGGMGQKKADTIKGEFTTNGFVNDLKHDRGVISMARTMIPDSASSQFFIMHANSPHLDGAYAGFGKVTKGIEVVDAIANVDTTYTDEPLKEVTISSIKLI